MKHGGSYGDPPGNVEGNSSSYHIWFYHTRLLHTFTFYQNWFLLYIYLHKPSSLRTGDHKQSTQLNIPKLFYIPM
jgi:hypothetical protein